MTSPRRLVEEGTEFERDVLASARLDMGRGEGLKRTLVAMGVGAIAISASASTAGAGVAAGGAATVAAGGGATVIGGAGAAILVKWIGLAVVVCAGTAVATASLHHRAPVPTALAAASSPTNLHAGAQSQPGPAMSSGLAGESDRPDLVEVSSAATAPMQSFERQAFAAPAKGSQRDAGVGPSARSGAAMAPIGDKLVLFGGFNGVGYQGDTWEWDGAAWTQLDITGPGPRSGALMAAFEGKVVLFGGTGQNFVTEDTWVFDGTTWTRPNLPSQGPLETRWGMASVARAPGSCTANCSSDVLVLFGPGASQNQTWTWDGTAWTQIDIAASNTNAYPPPAQGGLLSSTSGGVLLLDTSSSTWLWTAGGWTLGQTNPDLQARSDAVIAPLDANAILFGSNYAGSPTWFWNGSRWVPAFDPTSPPPRSGEAMATRFAPIATP